MSPDSAADSGRGPSHNGRWILHWNAEYPAVISTAIPPVSGIWNVDDPIEYPQPSSLVLNKGIKNRAVV